MPEQPRDMNVVRTQRIEKNEQKKHPVVLHTAAIDDSRAPAPVPEPPGNSDIPVRTVYYVEVENMSKEQVLLLGNTIAEMHENARGGAHYFIPVRFGKLKSDVVFEDEIMPMVNELCEVVDGKIQLKNKREVRVIRENVSM